MHLIKHPNFKLLLVVILTFIVFFPSVDGVLLNWDDTTYISNNPLLENDISLESFFDLYNFDSHISLVLFTFLAQIKIFGSNTNSFHLFNIIFHAFNVILVYKLTEKILKNNNWAILVALLFAIHPMKVETVAWIIQRKDILFTFFFLLSSLFYLKYTKNKKLVDILLVIVFSYLSGLCKIQALTLPFVFLILEFVYNKKLTLSSIIINTILLIIIITDIYNIDKIVYFIIIPLIAIHYNSRLNIFVSNLTKRISSKVTNKKIKKSLVNLDIFSIGIIVYTISLLLKIKSLYPFNFQSAFSTVYYIYYLIPLFLFFFHKKNHQNSPKQSKKRNILIAIIALTAPLTFIFYKISKVAISDPSEISKTLIYACNSLNYYLLKFFLPINLSAMHPYSDVSTSFDFKNVIQVLITIATVGLSVFGILKVKNKDLKRELSFGALFFLINISLVLHIIPISGKIIVADRYTYLAYLGLGIMAISLIKYVYNNHSLKKYHHLIKVVGIIIAVSFAFQSYSRSKLWKNDLTFWTDVISKDSTNHYAIYSLGLYYYEVGDFNQAIDNYNIAISLEDSKFEYYTNRAACYARTKNTIQAINDFETAIKMNPNDYASFYNRGILFFNIGDLENSRIDIEIALKIKPDYELATKQQEIVLKLIDAQNKYNIDSTQSYELSEYFNKLGMELAMNNQIPEALTFFEKAVSYDTLNIGAIQNRGNAYAATRDFISAKKDFTRIVELAPNQGGAYLNLANILHETGNVEEACENWEKAVSLGVVNAQQMLDKFCP